MLVFGGLGERAGECVRCLVRRNDVDVESTS